MTVVELLAAVAAVALVGAAILLFFRLSGSEDDGLRAAADAERILKATESWRVDNPDADGCPTVTQLLEESALAEDARPHDPWGGRFRVVCGDDDLHVTSAGKDGRRGTEDDVVRRAAPGA